MAPARQLYPFFLFVFATIFISSLTVAQNMIGWGDLMADSSSDNGESLRSGGNSVIVVAKDGSGAFSTLQQAIDHVPFGNKQRIKILIKPGFYREKILIPQGKGYLSLIGTGRAKDTIIDWNSKASDRNSNGQVIGTLQSATVAVESDYFCARHITFSNSAPAPAAGGKGTQAVALRISGDKSVLMECRIIGSQDTLFDHMGRHYFKRCFIQGSVDFIFGDGRSIYERCDLHATAVGYGSVAASQRMTGKESTGFSFVKCRLTGSGNLYLGRAWGPYARIVYSFCHFDNIIMPQGWSDWGQSSRQRTAFFGEYKCTGAGARKTERVGWMRREMSFDEVKPFLSEQFIDADQWLNANIVLS